MEDRDLAPPTTRFTPVNHRPPPDSEGRAVAALCICGVGGGGAAGAEAAQRIEEGLRRLLQGEEGCTGCLIVVEPNRTFIAFPSSPAASAFRARWNGQFLPHGVAAHRVHIKLAVPFRDRRMPEPDDSVAATAHVTVPGLGLLVQFVDEQEEQMLMEMLDACPWDEASLKGRRSQHYGAAAIDFRARDLYNSGSGSGSSHAPPPIPPACAVLLDRARGLLVDGRPVSDGSTTTTVPQPARGPRVEGPLAAGRDGGRAPDQMTVNDYQPGEGIAGHVDVHSLFEDGFLIVSLGSDCVMDFRQLGGQQQGHKAVLLPRRSLLVLEGEARYRWSHGIASRKSDMDPRGRVVARGRRVSLSFRRVRAPRGCACAYPQACDWQQQRGFGEAAAEAEAAH